MQAASLGWEFLEPISSPHWQLFDPDTISAVHSYLDKSQPDLVYITIPTAVWAPQREFNRRACARQERTIAQRRLHRQRLWPLLEAILRWSRSHPTQVMIAAPSDSDVWCEPLIAHNFPADVEIRTTKASHRKLKVCSASLEICEKLQFHERLKIHGLHQSPEGLESRILSAVSSSLKPRTQCYPADHDDDVDMNSAEDAESTRASTIPEERFADADTHGETNFMPGSVKSGHEESAKEIPAYVRKAVEAAHNRLGHPSRQTFLRMLRLAGSHPLAIRWAKIWTCPICQQRCAPKKPMKSSGTIRPYGFNHTVYVDLKFVQDVAGKAHAALSMVCAGTTFHRAAVLKTKTARYVARKFLRHWVSQFGPPLHVVHDQGGEFEREFAQYLEDMSISADVTGSHAPWQLAVGERHGGLLGVAWQAAIVEHRAEGRADIKTALDAAVLAKNTTITRSGFTPYQTVYGLLPRDPASVLADDDETNLTAHQALGFQGETGRAASMRHSAKIALLKLDASDKLRRAITRGPPQKGRDFEFLPGTRIYFWEPAPGKGRNRADPGRWRGPALTLIREKHNRYFVSWHGRLLLLAGENMRPASSEESAAFDIIHDEAEAFKKEWEEAGPPNYTDKSDDPPPPEPPQKSAPAPAPRDDTLLKGLKSVRKLLLKDKQPLRQPRQAIIPKTPESELSYAPDHASDDGNVSVQAYGPHAAEAPLTPEQSDAEGTEEEKFWKAVHEDEDEYIRNDPSADLLDRMRSSVRSKMSSTQAQEDAKMDVPISIKRTLELPMPEEEPEQKRVKETLLAGVMAASMEESDHANAWLNRDEIRQLKRILGMPGITAARIHKTPRKKLEKLPTDKKGQSLKRSRLSILIGHEMEDVYVLDHDPQEASEFGSRKMPFLWKGMTIFYQAKKRVKEAFYFETPFGLAKAKVHQDDLAQIHEETELIKQESRLRESWFLKLKQSGKELDPRHFDHKEKLAFDASDTKEWEAWLRNKSVELVDPVKARKVPKSKIFKLPLRFVRTNRATEQGHLIAKSRIVAPGHEDPGLGEFRTDAPTTDPLAVNLTKTVAVSLQWEVWIFDVETAFLSGKETDREIYVRAPKEGLPSTEYAGYVPPFALLKVLKSIYGLTEAPRLWYLMAREVFEKCGYVELKMSKSTFVLVDEHGLTQSICNLHVDDGFLIGNPAAKEFQDAFSKIKGNFNVKEWIDLKTKDHKYLGVITKVNPDGSITESMEKYIQEIKSIPVKRGDPDSRALEAKEVKAFRSLVMQLRWPAQKLLTQVLYGVSYLAQKVNEATVAHVKEANRLLKLAKEEVQAGRATYTYHAVDLSNVTVVTYFDASLGKEEGYKSQAGMMTFVTSAAALEKMTIANRVEHHSKKISRVVKSSMAAEAASLSMAVDKHLFTRVLLQALMYGEANIGSDWRKDLKISGYVVTDARALYDHITTTGSLPAERATMMDLLAAKELVEQALIVMRWVPTQHQYADHLTKSMICELMKQYLTDGKICLVQTGADAEKERHKAALRKAQRERRKERLKKNKTKPAAAAAPTNLVYRW